MADAPHRRISIVPIPLVDSGFCWNTAWQSILRREDDDTAFVVAPRGGPAARVTRVSLSPGDMERRMHEQPSLRADLSSFMDFYTADVHFGRSFTKVKESTALQYLKTLREFWGFLHMYVRQEKVWDFTAPMDGPKVLGFIAFRKVVQQNQVSTLTRTIFDLKAVMRWCMTIAFAKASVEEGLAAKQLYEQVERLCSQLKAGAPVKQPVDLEHLQAEGKWMLWSALRAKAEEYARDTLAAVQKLKPISNTSSAPDVVELARRLNVCLFAIMFAGLANVGPPRPFNLKSLVLVGVKSDHDEPNGTMRDRGAADLGEPENIFSPCSVCPPPVAPLPAGAAAAATTGRTTTSTGTPTRRSRGSSAVCRGNVIRKVDSETYAINITHHKTVGARSVYQAAIYSLKYE